ncbi:MAG TPA: MbnP family copper-binding protein [Myxococcaceae bacterium]|nr:MbnP family copper-binding protein [Myxococcaceae bacterium]
MKNLPGLALTAAATTTLLLSACGGQDEPLNLTIPFKARVGLEPFACGQTYTGLGTTLTTYQPKDLRLYVHAVRLVDKDGKEVPVALEEDGAWQGDGVALLDFEDKTGLCANGTEETRDIIVGKVPRGSYTALRFTVGVPFEKNHLAKETAKAPLGVSTLYWSWQGGYKFIRLDGATEGLPNGHAFHLGSTLCETSAPNVVSACANSNRFDVEISGFDPEQPSAVVLDVAALLAGSNLDANQPDTPAGCMAAPTDGDCGPIFQRLGLPFGDAPANAGGQVFFRKE